MSVQPAGSHYHSGGVGLSFGNPQELKQRIDDQMKQLQLFILKYKFDTIKFARLVEKTQMITDKIANIFANRTFPNINDGKMIDFGEERVDKEFQPLYKALAKETKVNEALQVIGYSLERTLQNDIEYALLNSGMNSSEYWYSFT